MVWIIGALLPFGVLVRPRISALLAALTGLIGLFPAGYLVWILLVWAPYPPGVAAAPGVVALLVLLLVGLGAEVCGMIAFAKSASRERNRVAVGSSGSSPPAPRGLDAACNPSKVPKPIGLPTKDPTRRLSSRKLEFPRLRALTAPPLGQIAPGIPAGALDRPSGAAWTGAARRERYSRTANIRDKLAELCATINSWMVLVRGQSSLEG